ncbi:MAG: signal peptidase I [Candidatus Paceibacterota bacterium]|jgi:signal peptidase I
MINSKIFKKTFKIFVLVSVIFLLIIIFNISSNTDQLIQINQHPDKQIVSANNSSCAYDEKEDIVVGSSMSGLIESGTKIKVLEGYYKCNPVKRDDIVIYKYAGNPEPLIKTVKAIDGDSWNLKKINSGYQIIVNEKVLRNQQSIPYVLSTQKSAMLKLYTKDYPIIPKDTFLILGNIPEGSLDSTRFGLIPKENIIGKVVW